MAEMRESNSEKVILHEGEKITPLKTNNSLQIRIDVDCSEALKGLKAVTREAKKATAALDDLEKAKGKIAKLLVIELDSETSIPRVFYEGKEINRKVRISFEWQTKTSEPDHTKFNIEHYSINECGRPILKGIGLER